MPNPVGCVISSNVSQLNTRKMDSVRATTMKKSHWWWCNSFHEMIIQAMAYNFLRNLQHNRNDDDDDKVGFRCYFICASCVLRQRHVNLCVANAFTSILCTKFSYNVMSRLNITDHHLHVAICIYRKEEIKIMMFESRRNRRRMAISIENNQYLHVLKLFLCGKRQKR